MTNNFEAYIPPKDKYRVGKTIFPEQKPNMTAWFQESKASTRVPIDTVVERHHFDMKTFERNQLGKRSKLLTFLNIFRTFAKNRLYGNGIN